MKRFVTLAVGLAIAVSAMAEATFDQIEGLIQQQNYAAAASGLEVIIQNHPKSAKAFYAMAQAQAGLGNLEKAQKALNIATGLNPTLDFAPASSVASLKQAITPQTAKIEAVETSHFWTTFAYFALFAGFAVACYFLYSVYARKEQEAEEKEISEKLMRQAEADEQRRQEHREAELARQLREQAERDEAVKAEEALKAHKNYGHERFDPANPNKLKSVAQFKKEQAEAARVLAEAEARRERARADAAEDEARRARMHYSSPAPTTTVVNNSSNDMLTGIMIGNMMGSHHDTERTVIRETVREAPAPSRDTSWDTPAPSRSSSWDSDSSSSSSSSWSSSSSDSSSSWSSSDSSSSSSWD
jgi:uncharacterized membrane protein YgcG